MFSTSSCCSLRSTVAVLCSVALVVPGACDDPKHSVAVGVVQSAPTNAGETTPTQWDSTPSNLWDSAPTQRLAFAEIHVSSGEAQSIEVTWRSTFEGYDIGPVVMANGQPIEILRGSGPGLHRSTVALRQGWQQYVFRDGPRTIDGAYAQIEQITTQNGQVDLPEQPTHRLVALGDSILCGFNSELPPIEAYAMSLRGALRVWRISTFASGGYGLYSGGPTHEARVALADDLVQSMDGSDANALLLAIGVNDHNSHFWSDAEEFGRAYAELLDLVHERAPGALILCMTPFLKYPDEAVAEYREQIALAVVARSPYSRLIDGTTVQPEMDKDGLHPNATGNRTIFNWLLPILRTHGIE